MRDTVSTIASLTEAPRSYQLFMAMRLLECAFSDQPRFATAATAYAEPVRLAQSSSLGFEAAMLTGVESDGHRQRLLVNGFGLLGANGPMPIHFSEYVRDRQRSFGDTTLKSFLDMFHHRLISLFYRAWANAQPTLHLDRPHEDKFSIYVGSLLGIGTAQLRQRDAIPDFAKLHFAGHLSRQNRNAEGLVAALGGFFQVPVALRQFVGSWMQLPPDGLTRLHSSGNAARQLGISAVLGRKIWNCQDKFRVVIGALSFQQYLRFLPDGASIQRLAAFIRGYAGLAFAWEVNLVLRKEEVPLLRLNGSARLGWTTWLLNRTPPQDDHQFLLQHSALSKE